LESENVRRINFYCAALLSCIAVSGCGEKEINGQVFVVTKGRDTIKLSLTDVAAYSEEEFAAALKVVADHPKRVEMRSAIVDANKMLKNMRDEGPALKSDYEAKRAAAESMEVSLSAQLATVSQQVDEAVKTKGRFSQAIEVSIGGERVPIEQAKGKLELAADAARQAAQKYFGVQKNIDGQEAMVGNLMSHLAAMDSVEWNFAHFPSAKYTNKTDAEGKFALRVPAGRYVLAARSSRAVFDKSEQYHWLVKVDASTDARQVFLSNDNFFETECGTCVRLPTH
jgi:hypothetical protein